MRRLILRRLAVAVPLVIVVTFLTFLLEAVAPGDTARTILGQDFTPEAYAQLRGALGLNDPLLVQYWRWLTGAVRGDLGVSPISGVDVGRVVTDRLAVTVALVAGTTVLSSLLGVALGMISAVRGGRLGRAVDVLSLVGFSMPAYWIGLVLISLFAVTFPIFPAIGYVSLSASISGWAMSLTLPVLTLTLGAMAVIAKQTRDGMMDVLAQDYVHTLRANGASEASLVLRHALRNAAIPVVTVLGLVLIRLLSGTVLVETVFALPGLGGAAVRATRQHDLPMIQGIAFVFALVVVVVNLVTDLSYGWLNPKARVQ